jgi:hypothetical protein
VVDINTADKSTVDAQLQQKAVPTIMKWMAADTPVRDSHSSGVMGQSSTDIRGRAIADADRVLRKRQIFEVIRISSALLLYTGWIMCLRYMCLCIYNVVL